MNNWQIFNQSSERMPQVADESVSLIITDPPFNIGTVFGDTVNLQPFTEYYDLLRHVLKECFRVLRPDGTLIIEAADTTFSGEGYVHLARMLQNLSRAIGFHLIRRHVNFALSDNGVELNEHPTDSYNTFSNNHSNCMQWLVFTKMPGPFNPQGKVFYCNYISSTIHPCSFSDRMCRELLEIGNFKPGQTVLDPFMGTGQLGLHVLAGNGNYIGYETEYSIFCIAKQQLRKA